jgi:iron complex transport system substrate-binding protein
VAHAKPARIVSLNLCTDQILVDLVPHERIRAVTHLAADPAVSAAADAARGLRATHGGAEDVIALAPDLVLAGTWTTPATATLLDRLRIPLVRVPLAGTMPEVRAVIRQVAQAVGEEAAGEAQIARLDASLATAARARRDGLRPTALVYQVNGLASGPGSFADTLLAEAGLRNLATEIGIGRGGQVPLEVLLARPPDILILSAAPDDYRTAAADNLRHPALRHASRAGATVVIPWRLWLCGTVAAGRAIDALLAARATLEDGRGR